MDMEKMQPDWSAWVPLLDCGKRMSLLDGPGLYRIRRIGQAELDYIGQTGRTLRERIGALRGVYGAVMPYRAPHTAGPALWALRQKTGEEYEASVWPVEGIDTWRKGLECVVLALYRQDWKRSPTVNFGRMPDGWRMSSGNNRKLTAAGMRFRGETVTEREASHLPGIGPAGLLEGDPQEADWGGHNWSDWVANGEVTGPPQGSGLYRIRAEGTGLVYVGQA